MKWIDDLLDDWDAVNDLLDALPDQEDEEIVTENLMNGIVLRKEDVVIRAVATMTNHRHVLTYDRFYSAEVGTCEYEP